nr:RNA polymerase sigma factor [Niveibacterium umoris]
MPHATLIAEIPRLRRYGRALTGDRARADDLVQDTLERALQHREKWAGGSARAWLFTLMHRIWLNQVRRPQADSLDDGDLAPDQPVAALQDRWGDSRDLEQALARLPDEQREVLLLVALEEFSYEEAAEVLGIPVGTVMSRLFRARERLRRMLERSPFPQPALKRVK